MKQKNKILKIWLKGKEKPIQLIASAETIMDFTDFTVRESGQFIFRYPDARGNKRYMMIQSNQIQAIDFDDFDLTEV